MALVIVERGEDDGVEEDVVVYDAYLRMVEAEYEDLCDDGKELEAAEDVVHEFDDENDVRNSLLGLD